MSKICCGWRLKRINKIIEKKIFSEKQNLTVVVDCVEEYFCCKSFVNILNGINVWFPLILIATICCWFVWVWTVGCCCWITVWFKITLTFVCEPIVWLSTRVVSFVVANCCVWVWEEFVNDGFVLKLNVFCVICTFVLFVVFWL